MTDLVQKLVGALECMLNRYVELVESGDAGKWDAEAEPDVIAARAALSEAKAGGWLPIETAPKDETFLAVLACGGEQTICTMRHSVAEAKNSRPHGDFERERVTHWQPLPAPPAQRGEG